MLFFQGFIKCVKSIIDFLKWLWFTISFTFWLFVIIMFSFWIITLYIDYKDDIIDARRRLARRIKKTLTKAVLRPLMLWLLQSFWGNVLLLVTTCLIIEAYLEYKHYKYLSSEDSELEDVDTDYRDRSCQNFQNCDTEDSDSDESSK